MRINDGIIAVKLHYFNFYNTNLNRSDTRHSIVVDENSQIF